MFFITYGFVVSVNKKYLYVTLELTDKCVVSASTKWNCDIIRVLFIFIFAIGQTTYTATYSPGKYISHAAQIYFLKSFFFVFSPNLL